MIVSPSLSIAVLSTNAIDRAELDFREYNNDEGVQWRLRINIKIKNAKLKTKDSLGK